MERASLVYLAKIDDLYSSESGAAPDGSSCEWCEGPIIKAGKRFCSLKCSVAQQNAFRAIKFKFCECCGKSFPINKPGTGKNKRFCNRSCSATFNNHKFCKKPTPGSKVCLNCGILYTRKNQDIYKYCSMQCDQEYRQKQYIKAWLNNEIVGCSDKGILSRRIRKYLLDLSGNKCSRCGWYKLNPVTNNVPLEIDHIDGDCFNCRPTNLQVLCPNCHSLTPTFRALNKVSGRVFRRTNGTCSNKA